MIEFKKGEVVTQAGISTVGWPLMFKRLLQLPTGIEDKTGEQIGEQLT